jgi:hypothetical protein
VSRSGASSYVSCSSSLFPGAAVCQSAQSMTTRHDYSLLTFNCAGYVSLVVSESSATFTNPQSVALDTFGGVYVAEYNGNCIRYITSGGLCKIH